MAMKIVRIGNDISVHWKIFAEDDQFNLSGRDIKIYLTNAFERTEIKEFSVSENNIQFTFYGKDQKYLGKYSLQLCINENAEGMITTDLCDFIRLVPCTCNVGSSEEVPNIEVESVTLETELDFQIIVDAELSETSANPVENRVITAELKNKANTEDVKALILKEHGYFKYNKSENLVYFKGYIEPDWTPALIWHINSAVGVPLTVHMLIPSASSEAPVSTNKFELYGANLEAPYMTWVYDGLLYTMTFGDNNSQIITTEPYNESEDSYDDSEIREELSRKLEAEVVATTEPTAEFPQLLYTPQTLTEAQKSQARKNIGVGEGGGDGGAELVEFIYLFDQELSEEQVAINVASYAKMVSGGNYIPYVKTNNGINLGVSLWMIDNGILGLTIESEALLYLGFNKIMIAIEATGEILTLSIPINTQILFVDELESYEILRERALSLLGGLGLTVNPIRTVGRSVADLRSLGWVNELYVNEDGVYLEYTTDYGEKCVIYGYGGNQPVIGKEIIAGGTIYLGVTDPTSNLAKNNKMINLSYLMGNTFNIRVVNDDTDWSYTPLMIKSGAVVIYRNGTMEEWTINSDGTTTLSQ